MNETTTLRCLSISGNNIKQRFTFVEAADFLGLSFNELAARLLRSQEIRVWKYIVRVLPEEQT